MSQSFKVLFFLKKGKRCNVKSLPIYVRITINGKRAEWSVQRSCESGSKWNQAVGRATGNKGILDVVSVFVLFIKIHCSPSMPIEISFRVSIITSL